MRRAASLALLLCLLAAAPPPGDCTPVPPPPPPAEGTAPPPGWDNAWKGEIRVEGAVTVPKGCVLTLLPGTKVLLAPGGRLDVDGGKLVAAGEEGNPVRFLPAADNARWGGIRFREAAEGSLLSRCVVEGAEAVSVEKSPVPVRDSVFSGGKVGLSLSSGSSAPVERNEFRDLEVGGLSCDGASHPDVRGNRFSRCAAWGLYVLNDSHPRVVGNDFSRCGEGAHVKGRLDRPVAGNRFAGNRIALVLEEVPPGTVVSKNRVEGNETGIACIQLSSPTIEGNRVLGNGTGVHVMRNSSPAVRRNEIAGNGVGLVALGLSEPRAEGNDFRDNGRHVVLDSSAYAVVHGNNFDGAGIRLELREQMSADWEHRVREKPVRGWLAREQERASRNIPTRSVPEDPSRPPELEGALDGTVDARGNWWGAEATAEMERLGADGNVAAIVDGRDVPVRRYPGFEGEFLQDRVDFSGWARKRIEGTGPGAVAEAGTP